MMAYEINQMTHGMESLEWNGLMPDFLLWVRLMNGAEVPLDGKFKHMK